VIGRRKRFDGVEEGGSRGAAAVSGKERISGLYVAPLAVFDGELRRRASMLRVTEVYAPRIWLAPIDFEHRNAGFGWVGGRKEGILCKQERASRSSIFRVVHSR